MALFGARVVGVPVSATHSIIGSIVGVGATTSWRAR
jgi:phosphate/sulfate permease